MIDRADPTYLQREQALKDQAAKGHKMIWVTFRKEGIHKYPAALDDPKLATGDEYDYAKDTGGDIIGEATLTKGDEITNTDNKDKLNSSYQNISFIPK